MRASTVLAVVAAMLVLNVRGAGATDPPTSVSPANGSFVKSPGSVTATFAAGTSINPATATLTVTKHGGAAVGGTVVASGNTVTFRPTPGTSIGEGLYDAAVRAQAVADPAFATRSWSFTVDNTGPVTPTVVVPGSVKNSVTVTGKTEANVAVAVSVTDSTVGSATADVTSSGDGSYSATLDISSLSDGTLTVTVTATDAAGNDSADGTAKTTKSTSAPATPSVDQPPNAVSSNQTAVPYTGDTDGDTTLPPGPGPQIKIVVDDDVAETPAVSKTINISGATWSTTMDLSSLHDGLLSVNVYGVGSDGTLSAPASPSDDVSKDTVGPVRQSTSPSDVSTVRAPASVSATYNESLGQGTSNDTGSTIKIFDVTGAATAVPCSKSFASTVAQPGTQNTKIIKCTPDDTPAFVNGHTYEVRLNVLDGGANVTPQSTYRFTISDTGVSQPSVDATGPVNTLNQAAYTVTGTADPNTPVNVSFTGTTGLLSMASTVTKTVTSAADGTWTATLDLHTLNDGNLSLSVTAGSGGGTSAAVTRTVVKDTAVPANPVVSTVTDPVNAANKATVTVTGTKGANEDVLTVSLDDTDAGTPARSQKVTVASTSWTATFDASTLTDGTLTASARAVDPNGNPSAGAGSKTALKDATVPALVTAVPANGEVPATAPSTVKVTYSESLAASSTLSVKDRSGNAVTGTVTKADADRSLVFMPTVALSQDNAPYVVSVTAKDAAGNTATDGTTFDIDPLGRNTITPLATPVRVLDTRTGLGATRNRVGPDGTLSFTVAGATTGVPPEATAVVLNLTATNFTSAGETFVTAYPAGGARPNASNLNVRTTSPTPNLVTVPVGQGGKVTLYNQQGQLDLIADIFGYAKDSKAQVASGTVVPVTPVRIYDTRDGTGGATGSVGSGKTVDVTVAGANGVPATGVGAAIVNITAVGATADQTYVTAFPAGQSVPTASNINLVGAAARPNLALVGLGTGGKISIFNQAGNTDVLVDLVGYTNSTGESTASGTFVPLTPARLLDTRTGTGGVPMAKVDGGSSVEAPALNNGGLPASGVAAVFLNVTGVNLTGAPASYITAYPAGAARPNASTVNLSNGLATPNAALTKVGAGRLAFYNFAGSVDVIADAGGFIR